MNKEERFELRLTKDEKALAESDAHRHEMNLSQYIRWLIEKEWYAVNATAPAELKAAMGFKEGQK